MRSLLLCEVSIFFLTVVRTQSGEAAGLAVPWRKVLRSGSVRPSQAFSFSPNTLSQARRIAPVVTANNHEHWIAEAKHLPQTELERRIAAENPKAHIKEKIRPLTM